MMIIFDLSAQDTGYLPAGYRMIFVVAVLAAAGLAAGTNIVSVRPGQLYRCAAAALQAEAEAEASAAAGSFNNPVQKTRCVLAPGIYRETLEYVGSAPLEIVGAG